MSNVVAIAKTLEKMLSLWETFIRTRQQAYERKMDKRKRKAIDTAEKIILRLKELGIEDKIINRQVEIFFKYNN
jgi:hypothetical protein